MGSRSELPEPIGAPAFGRFRRPAPTRGRIERSGRPREARTTGGCLTSSLKNPPSSGSNEREKGHGEDRAAEKRLLQADRVAPRTNLRRDLSRAAGRRAAECPVVARLLSNRTLPEVTAAITTASARTGSPPIDSVHSRARRQTRSSCAGSKRGIPRPCFRSRSLHCTRSRARSERTSPRSMRASRRRNRSTVGSDPFRGAMVSPVGTRA